MQVVHEQGEIGPDARVLVVDDDAVVRRSIRRRLAQDGFDVVEAGDGEQALEALRSSAFDAALIDIHMPGLSGLDVVARARTLSPATECVVVTGQGDIDTALRCIDVGASDYFEKPVQDWSRLERVLKRAVAFSKLRKENEALRVEGGDDLLFGASSGMHALRQSVRVLGAASAPVLIHGETGSGKELVARALHEVSGRRGPFVAVNCGAIPENLLESELFGHEAGAHSTATGARKGLFAQADEGTLLLDEIGEMPLALQVKLLRALDDSTFRPLGGVEQPLTARIVAATHRDLQERVDAQAFREDLMFRMDVLRIEIPPLRERPGDIMLLTYRFINEANRVEGRSVRHVSADTIRLLETYPWPGNVRELRNAVRAAVVVSDGDELAVLGLPERVRTLTVAGNERAPILETDANDDLFHRPYAEAKAAAADRFASAYVSHQLSQAEGIVAQAARRAGMAGPNFHRLMRRLGLGS